MSFINTVKVLLVAAIAGLSPAVLAEAFTVSHTGKGHDSLYDICFGDYGVAVGDHGLVLIREDAGGSWQPVDVPDDAVAFLGASCRADKAVIVGQLGKAYLRENNAWVAADTGTDARLLSVAMSPAGQGFAVGAFGTVLKTTDGGHNWEVLSIDWEAVLDDFVEPHIYDVAILPNGVVTVAGEFGLVVQSADKGATWTVTNRGEESVFALQFRDALDGYAVGQNGLVLRTTDGGASWLQLDVDTSENLLGVLSTPEGDVVVTGIRTLLRSMNDGASWQYITSGDVATGWYQGIAEAVGPAGASSDNSAAHEIYAVGNTGKIIRIQD